MRALSIPQIFSGRQKETKSIQTIKSQAVAGRRGRVQPFWLYTSYVLIALNVLVMLAYLLGVNTQAASGYEIQQEQNQIQNLTDAGKQLNLQLSEATSIAEIQTDYLNSGYVPAGQISYLQDSNRYTER
jgi:hypothetical protein